MNNGRRRQDRGTAAGAILPFALVMFRGAVD
jgi:hypothetical protein